MKSWRTSILGVAAILTAVISAVVALVDGDPNTVVNVEATIAAVMVGAGLIAARDNGVTSKTAGAK